MFHVNEEGILEPLGVKVLGDSRYEILPSTRDHTEEIDGADGEVDFGTELRPRALELHCVTPDGLTKAEKIQFRYDIAKYLNPKLGYNPLTFADEPGKVYLVKYAGSLSFIPNKQWFDFTIPFKMGKPYILSETEKSHVGSGTLLNEGSEEAALVIEIQGTVTNPTVVVGGKELTYTGVVSAGDKVIIDTGKETVKFNTANGLHNYSGGFPKLQPGETSVTAAGGGTTTFKWIERWL